MNIIEVLKRNAKRLPGHAALIHRGQTLTYQQLEVRSAAAARFFAANGVSHGQKALLFIPLSIELYEMFLALVRLGVSVVLIDPSAGRKSIEHCVNSVSPEVFIATPKAHLLRISRAVAAIPKKFHTCGWLPGSRRMSEMTGENSYRDWPTAADHLALMTFTSGSTGLPKGIARSHGFLINQYETIARTLPYQPGDIELNTLPVFILSNLAAGITTVIPDVDVKNPARVDAGKVLAQIQGERVNRILASPAFCQQLMDALAQNSQSLKLVSRIYTGGGPVFPGLLTTLQRRCPQAEVSVVYGSTEAEPMAHVCAQEITAEQWQKMRQGAGLLAGKPVADIDLAILPDQDGTAIGPFDGQQFDALKLRQQPGEIVIRGAHVQKGYFCGDERKNKFCVDGVTWHRSGDAGYLDSVGNLWLLGRCSAKFIKDGERIYPFGLETAAMAFAGVKKAALVEMHGKVVLAIESEADNPDEQQAELMRCLSVDRVQILAKIPMDKRHHSKVLYDELKRMLSNIA